MRDSIELIRLRGAKEAFFEEARDSSFRSAVESAPFLIRSNGLGSGLATLAAKEGEQKKIAAMLALWLMRDCPYRPLTNGQAPPEARSSGVKHALAKITECDRATYRASQIEAIGYLTHLKRLAQAFCPKGESDG